MGVMATILDMVKGRLTTKGNAPGKSTVMTGTGFPGQVLTPEVYQAPGVFGIPGDGVKGIYIPVGGSSRYGVVIAMHNYQIEIDVGGQGGASIYSTTADGKTVKSKVVLTPGGEIQLNGDGKELVTWSELNTALSAFLTQLTTAMTTTPIVGNGSPQAAWTGMPTSIDISGARTQTVKTGG